MQKKCVGYFLSAMMITVLLSLHTLNYAVIAYIPEALRQCIRSVYEIAEKSDDTRNLQELYAIISENRMLTCDVLMRNAVDEALAVIAKKGIEKDPQQVSAYLKEYRNALNDRCLLLNLHTDKLSPEALPISLIARSLDNKLAHVDMMNLHCQLASVQNVELCGNMDDNAQVTRSIKSNKVGDPGMVFNSNMMTSAASITPNVIFGATGVSSPVINVWSMSPSAVTQFPVNMQFLIPGDLKTQKAMSLELHFLVKKQAGANGNARIQVNAEYMRQHGEFDIFNESPSFTYTTASNNFLITEPSSTNNVEHVYVIVPIEKQNICNHNFALLSVSRIAPTSGVEYSQDIYLAAAAFIYTKKT